ncbi:MAG TPA: hypothetical protein VHK28_06180 [Candidatus Limnocylindria bacterium]|nr:hypothetical protein [Candidatus Limnocylindria bacterium]
MDRWAGLAAIAGFAIWTVAFFAPASLAWLLTVANLVGGAGLAWMGWSIWSRPMTVTA